MLSTIDSHGFSHFTPDELKLVRDIYLEISREPWFDQDKKDHFGAYVISMYQRGMIDRNKLRSLCLIAAQDKYRVAEAEPLETTAE